MPYLTQFGELRYETNSEAIATLNRKGWVTIGDPPEYDPYTQQAPRWSFDSESWVIDPLPEDVLAWNNFQALVEQGYHVLPEDFYLGIQDDDLINWNQLDSGLTKGIKVGYLTEEATFKLVDKFGNPHEVTVARWDQILAQLFIYYKTIWDIKMGI